LIAFYYAIMRSEEVRTHSFLWMNLGAPDPYYLMPVLAAVTTYLQSKVMGTTNNNPQAQLFLFIMPAMILFIAITLPSALSLYWVFSNLFTIGQTLVLKRIGYLQPQEGTAK
jgi:membrane protein insertase, YidC/Oxa1 family, C-terminal domain